MKFKLVREVSTDKSATREAVLCEVLDWHLDNTMKKGEGVLVHFHNKDKLFTCCPACGLSSFTGNHKITNNNGLFSAHPSLRFQCCGWHGFLTDGIFHVE